MSVSKLMVVAGLTLAGGLSAADLTWNGAADNLWSGANWGGQTWVAGSRAVFSSPVEVTVNAATGQVGGFLFNDNVTLTGNGTITLAAATVTVASGKTAKIEAPLAGSAGLVKEGAGTLEVTQRQFTGQLKVNAGKGQFAVPQGTTWSLDLNNGAATTGHAVFIGPGRLNISKRVYPNTASGAFTFDGGITFELTTHNSATDGLFVSGTQSCPVNLGDCTVINAKAGNPVTLSRYVTLNLTDTTKGATISTRNSSGSVITLNTNPSQQAIIKGSGRLNLIGGGTFTFDAKTTFSNTGLITVSDGTTAKLNTAVANAPFLVKEGGVLTCASYVPVKQVTVANGGVLDLGTATTNMVFAGGLYLEAGSTLRFTVGAKAPSIAQRTDGDYNKGLGLYPPYNGGRVTLAPVAGTGLAAGRYPILTGVLNFNPAMFDLAQSTLGAFNLGIEKDGNNIVLVVTENAWTGWCVWSGAAGDDWSGLNWDGGAAFVAGAGARFATAGAEVAVAAGTPSARALDFTATTRIAGTGPINLSTSEISVGANCTATIDAPVKGPDGILCKYGPGKLVLDAAANSPIKAAAYEGQLELRLADGESATYTRTGSDHTRIGGVSFIGPGTFTTDRQYPRNFGSTNVIDGGATMILTSLNGAGDGIIVSGGADSDPLERYGVVALGNCTIRSGYDITTLLQRSVNLHFTDADNGATFWTEGPSGSPITLKTAAAGRFFGEGTMNIGGTGIFVFSATPTFALTGRIQVRNGATARFENNVAGTVVLEGGARALFANGAKTLNGLTLAADSILEITLAAGTQSKCVVTKGVTWPVEGKALVRISGEARLANGTYTLVQNAGADALAHLTAQMMVPGKNIELVVQNGNLNAVVTTGNSPELTWKGGAGNWSDADGWNDDAWIDAAHAVFPAVGGTVALADSVTLGGLSVLGASEITGSGAIVFAPTDNVARVEADLTIAPSLSLAAKTLVKTGVGKLTLTGEAQTLDSTLDIRGGEVAYTQPANGLTKITLANDTGVALGGGNIAATAMVWSGGTNTFRNGTITVAGDTFRTDKGHGQTFIFDDGAAINAPNGRFWVYNGGEVIMGPNCGKLSFKNSKSSSYVGAADSGTCNLLTIEGGELEIVSNTPFGIGARPEAGVTGVVHMVGGAFTLQGATLTMGRKWFDDDSCKSHGELFLDGGTLTTPKFCVGAEFAYEQPHTGDAVLHFNGGTTVVGSFQLHRFVDREVHFNGTVFKPQADSEEFMVQVRPCEPSYRNVVEIGEGNLIVDTDGFNAGYAIAPTGVGGLVKRGAGTLTLKVPQLYAGLTAVEGGTLACGAGKFAFTGGLSVAAGAVLDVGLAKVAFGGTAILADGATLAATVGSGVAGEFAAVSVVQEGDLTLAVTMPAGWCGIATLIADVTGMDLDRVTVTGLAAGATTRVVGQRLVVMSADALVWKGGTGTWADADGWNEGAWVNGATAWFQDAAGSVVTLGESVNVAAFGFLENTTLVAGNGAAAVNLAATGIEVPSEKTVTVGSTLQATGLAKTGAGTLVLGGAQPSLGSLAIAGGTVQVSGTVTGLASLTGETGAKLGFDQAASVAVTGRVALPGDALQLQAGNTATLTAGTFEIASGFVVPTGLTVEAQTIPTVTITNNVLGFTVNGTLIDHDTLVVGYANSGTYAPSTRDDYTTATYEIAGTGTLRVKEMRMRTISTQHFTVNRLEVMGPHLYTQGNAKPADNCWGILNFDGTTIVPYDTDIGTDGAVDHLNNPGEIKFEVNDGGVTFDTVDAKDGTTARTIAFCEQNLTFKGTGPLTKVGAGTLIFGITNACTGATRIQAGTMKVMAPSRTSGYAVEGTGTTLQFAGMLEELNPISLGTGSVLTLGNGVARTEVAASTLTIAAGASIEIQASGAAGMPFLDLSQTSLTLPIESAVPVRVVVQSELPNGEYPILKMATLDAEAFARYALTIVNPTGCTMEVVRHDVLGLISVRVGGSSTSVTVNRWAGRGETGSWSTALNWSAGAVPDELAPLLFAGAGNLTNINDTTSKKFPAMVFEADSGAFDIDLNGTDIGVVTNLVAQNGAVQKVRNLTTTASRFDVWGTGTTWLVDPTFAGVVSQPSTIGENLLVIELSEGKDLTFNSWDHSHNGGPRRFVGPGVITMDRVFPNKTSAPVAFDGGITAWVTTHNPSSDGLFVSGNSACEVCLGDCTIGTTFKTETELARYVVIRFTDAEKGTTVMTDNKNGESISIITTGGYSGAATYAGEGALNIDGHGTFTFSKPQSGKVATKFTYTGETRVRSNATVRVQAGIAIPGSPFAVAGTLALAERAALGKPLTVPAGGSLVLEGTPALTGTVFAGGSQLKLTMPSEWTGNAKLVGKVTAPANGRTTVVVDCMSRPQPDTFYPLTQGAQLRSADAEHFTLVTNLDGNPTQFNFIPKLAVKDGELCVVFRRYFTIYVR